MSAPWRTTATHRCAFAICGQHVGWMWRVVVAGLFADFFDAVTREHPLIDRIAMWACIARLLGALTCRDESLRNVPP